MPFKKLSLEGITLPYGIELGSTTLSLSQEDQDAYCAAMPIDGYTYATIKQDGLSEVIKIGPCDYMGTIPILERGKVPLVLTAGACISFSWTDEAIADLYPESTLAFLDACGKPTDCLCDCLPTLTVGQQASIIIPYQAAASSTAVANIPGMTVINYVEYTEVSGIPTTPGTFGFMVTIKDGARQKRATCSLKIEAANAGATSGC